MELIRRPACPNPSAQHPHSLLCYFGQGQQEQQLLLGQTSHFVADSMAGPGRSAGAIGHTVERKPWPSRSSSRRRSGPGSGQARPKRGRQLGIEGGFLFASWLHN